MIKFTATKLFNIFISKPSKIIKNFTGELFNVQLRKSLSINTENEHTGDEVLSSVSCDDITQIKPNLQDPFGEEKIIGHYITESGVREFRVDADGKPYDVSIIGSTKSVPST